MTDANTNAAIKPPKSRNDPCPCGSGKRYKSCHGVVASLVSAPTESNPLTTVMNAALKAQMAGELQAAEALYREALTIDPNQVDCLHMLGVVRMQRFDLNEALALIGRAGELVEWSLPSFRHNYAHLLSSFLSAREPANLAQRLRAMHEKRARQRATNTTRSERGYCVVVIAANAAPSACATTLDSLAALANPPSDVVVLGADEHSASTYPFTVRSALWSDNGSNATANVSAALERSAARHAVILQAGDIVEPGLTAALNDLDASGARWGVGRCVAQDPRVDDLPASALESSFTLLQHAARISAALFADAEPIAPVCNVLWERQFLLKRLAVQPAAYLSLCEMAAWEDEPIFLNHVVVRFLTRLPLSSAFWIRQSAVAELGDHAYLGLALSGRTAPNPVAPTIEFDGVAFLKRALRVSLGARLSPDALRLIASRVTGAKSDAVALDSNGLELIGFVRAEIGLGESLRQLARACSAVATPIALTNIALDMGIRQSDSSLDAFLVEAPTFRTRLVCTNPDSLGEGNLVDGAYALPDAYNIGYWYWELENLPTAWVDAGNLIDELWVATDFVATAARKVIDKRIVKITPPIDERQPSRRYTRAEFGLPETAFLFLFSFDFGSYPARKNPEAVVRAFKFAFSRGETNAHLIVKCHRAHTFPDAHRALLQAIGEDPRVTVLDQTLTRDALAGLQSVIDCYISLHRSEGLGLGLAECMALGKPVIGTAYSGNLEFMRENNSLLVDYTMVPVKEGEYLDWQNQHWAEANVVHAAEHMRRLFDDRAFARTLGVAGQKTIREEYSREAVGRRIRAQLDRINTTLSGDPRANGNAMQRHLMQKNKNAQAQ